MSHVTRNSIITRPDHLKLPEWKLPLYPRSAGISEYCPGDFQDSAPRTFVQINWCNSGDGDITQEECTFPIVPGGVWFTPPGRRCLTRHRQGILRIRWVTFDGPEAERFLAGYGYPRHIPAAGGCPEELFRRFEEALRENTVEAMRRNIAVLCEILAAAGGTHSDGSREGNLIDAFLSLARREFRNPEVDFNTLCDRLKVHRATLTRIFTSKMQISPGKYLHGLRIQHALHLLRSSRMPIHEVARETGIRDSGYFARVIRETTGMTPGAYRRTR